MFQDHQVQLIQDQIVTTIVQAGRVHLETAGQAHLEAAGQVQAAQGLAAAKGLVEEDKSILI